MCDACVESGLSRRTLFQGGLGLLAAAALPAAAYAQAAQSPSDTPDAAQLRPGDGDAVPGGAW